MATVINREIPSRCPDCGSPFAITGCGRCGVLSLASWDPAKHPRDKSGHWGHGGNGVQSAPGSSHQYKTLSPGSADAHVKTAIGLLAGVVDIDPSTIQIAHTAPPPRMGQVPTAWTDPTDGRIFVNDQSRAYRQANKSPVELAGALAHEKFHRDHGADEGAAYAHQIAVLRHLGASKSLIADIQRASQEYRR